MVGWEKLDEGYLLKRVDVIVVGLVRRSSDRSKLTRLRTAIYLAKLEDITES